MTRTDRIKQMEDILDEAVPAIRALEKALEAYEEIYEKIRQLEVYYTDGSWLQDYEADEQGKLPETLKRGVLSQDAVYDLLANEQALKETLHRLTEKVNIRL